MSDSPTANWLLSLPDDLKKYIDASAATLTQAIDRCKNAISPVPLTTTAISLTFLLASQAPLEELLDVLKYSPVTCS